MKITVSRSLLSDALRKVQGIAAGKNAMAILSNVKIEAQGQKAKFTTTDLDMSVVQEITCNVIVEGAITLPAKLLTEAIARSPEGDVTIEVDETKSKATIHAGSSIFKIAGLPAVDFPTLPTADSNEAEVTIPQEILKSMFRRTAFAMSVDDTRRTLKGLHVEFTDGALTCVATDGRRMAIAEYHPDEAYTFSLSFTLPAKTVGEMLKNLGNTGNAVFQKCLSQITVSLDNGITIYSKLIDDAFPNYKQVIPNDNTNVVVIDRASLISSIERVGIFAEAQTMKFAFANNEVKLTSSTESGIGEDTVPVKYDGPEITPTFNQAYILDALKPIDDDEIKFAFSDATHPVIITSSLPGLALIMPLRLN